MNADPCGSGSTALHVADQSGVVAETGIVWSGVLYAVVAGILTFCGAFQNGPAVSK